MFPQYAISPKLFIIRKKPTTKYANILNGQVIKYTCPFYFLKGGVNVSVKIEVNNGVINAYLDGELDHHTAKVMREEIDGAVESNIPSQLILDFKDITFMDSSGIGLVMGRYKLLSKFGGELIITNPSPQIYKVMHLAGLSRLARIEKGGITNETNK